MPASVRSLSAAEFARQMARREIVYRRPARRWQNGLTIGNGDLGGAVFGGGKESAGIIAATLSKVDVWDERYDRKGHRCHTLAELRELIAANAGSAEGRKRLNELEPYGLVAEADWFKRTYPYPYSPPTPKPCGIVRVDPGGAFEAFEARLSVHRGAVEFALGDEQRGAAVSIFIDANSNLLVVRVRRHGQHDRPIRFELARYVDDQLGEPEVAAEEGRLWHRYVFPDGFAYAACGVVAGGEVAGAETSRGRWRDVQAMNGWTGGGHMRNWQVDLEAPERQARLTLDAGCDAASLLLCVATSKEHERPLARARALAAGAAERGCDAVAADHLGWWEAFWRRSSLVLSDRLVEALWYQGLYLLACQSRGAIPPPVVGCGYYLPSGAWHGAMITDYNLEMTYWPVFAANHVELAGTCFEFFWGHLDTMKAETARLYGIDGVKFPGITNGTCRELSYLPCRNWQCVSAWCAQLYWWGYLYTGEADFLRQRAYPILREVAKFYRAYATAGEDGRYHIFPSTPPEQHPWWATDPAIDLALIRTHMAAALAASELVGLDEDLREGWRDLLENLAEIPHNGEVFLDHRDAAPDSRLGHTALLCSTFTAGLIGIGSPPAERDMAVRTLRGLPARSSRSVEGYPYDIPTWNDDCCWPNMVGYAARLGLAEEAGRFLYDFGIFQHLKCNGVFAFDCPVSNEQRRTRWGMPDSNYAMIAAVSEMLLQSYDGVIRVAPACPADWEASFSGFLAVGAFEVDADISAGQVRGLTVRSLKGSPCRVVNPWPGRGVKITSEGRQVPFEQSDGVIAFDTEAGSTYTIARPEDVSEGPSPAGGEEAAGPICYRGPAFMGDVPEHERLAVWLGIPADDP